MHAAALCKRADYRGPPPRERERERGDYRHRGRRSPSPPRRGDSPRRRGSDGRGASCFALRTNWFQSERGSRRVSAAGRCVGGCVDVAVSSAAGIPCALPRSFAETTSSGKHAKACLDSSVLSFGRLIVVQGGMTTVDATTEGDRGEQNCFRGPAFAYRAVFRLRACNHASTSRCSVERMPRQRGPVLSDSSPATVAACSAGRESVRLFCSSQTCELQLLLC